MEFLCCIHVVNVYVKKVRALYLIGIICEMIQWMLQNYHVWSHFFFAAHYIFFYNSFLFPPLFICSTQFYFV